MPGPDLFDVLLRQHGAESLGRNYVFVRLARMNIAGHIDYSETSRILSAIRRKAEWGPVWLQAAERHRAMAEAARSNGAFTSAGDAFLRAALCAHWATLYAPPETKNTAHQLSLDLYAAGSPYFEPPARRIEIEIWDDKLPAYVRLPTGGTDKAIVMIGGADTNKEELHHWGTEFCRRGFMTVTFDGPGQGELSARYGRSMMRFDTFHEAVSAVIDACETEAGSPLSGIGVFGNSLGGYLALDAGMRDDRIGAVICNGGFCDARSMSSWPDGVLLAFASCLGITDQQELREHISGSLDLAKVDAKNRPPALVIHGGREDLSTEEEARDAAKTVDGHLVVVEDGWHTCTNRDHLVSALFGDWMEAALAGKVSSGYRESRATDEADYPGILSVP